MAIRLERRAATVLPVHLTSATEASTAGRLQSTLHRETVHAIRSLRVICDFDEMYVSIDKSVRSICATEACGSWLFTRYAWFGPMLRSAAAKLRPPPII